MAKPDLSTVPPFYHNYINQVKQDDLKDALKDTTKEATTFFKAIPKKKWGHRYAEGKWSVKELVQHIIDAERVFSYRALRFARKDETELPSFDENKFAAASKADNRTKKELIKEFEAVREATELQFESFDDEQLEATGIANKNSISVKAIGFIIAGHVIHHMNIIRERYLEKRQ